MILLVSLTLGPSRWLNDLEVKLIELKQSAVLRVVLLIIDVFD